MKTPRHTPSRPVPEAGNANPHRGQGRDGNTIKVFPFPTYKGGTGTGTPLDHTCPTCQATPGEPCTTVTGQPMTLHHQTRTRR